MAAKPAPTPGSVVRTCSEQSRAVARRARATPCRDTSESAGADAAGIDLVGDHHASASYRGHLIGVYAERALLAAAS